MIHVVLGPPCAGKSTYIREHSKSGDVLVDYDVIAQALGEKEKHGATGAIKEAAYKSRNAAINYLLENDGEGWIIHSSPSEWQMKRYEEAGADIIRLDVDEDTCIERAEADGRPAEEVERIHEWFKEHEKSAGRKTMAIKRKIVEVKAAENGSITGYASTWTREPDSYGDVVAKGAFAECIEKIKEEGRVLPLLYDHQEYDLNSFLGKAYDFKEDDHGLLFSADFDDTKEGQRARELAKDGRLCKFSFAYEVLDEGEVELEDGRKANELRKLNIFEVSLVFYPANDDTSVVEVKSGRRNSAADEETLRQIIALAQGLLGELDDNDEQDDDAKSKEPDPANDEERKRQLLKEAETLLKKE